MTQFVRGLNPIWFFNNLVGQVFDDTYYAFFLTNTLPYLPQAVYQDPNGTVAWSDPIEFQASGGLPNNIYFDETLTYRIEIRQGNTQNDPLIYVIENYTPSGQFDETFDELLNSENLITNPQFADVYFNNTVTYTTAGTYDIAQGWQLVLTGVGSTTLTQGTNPGNSNIFGSPAYYLQVQSSGWDSVQLVQTFQNNGSIFANGAIAMAFTAACTGAAHQLTVSYVPNGTANSQDIFQGTIATGGLVPYYGAINISPSLNANTDGDAEVQIAFTLPTSDIISLSNIQLLGQSTNLSAGFVLPDGTDQGDVPAYRELTYERMVDHEFNVYRNALVMEPKNTIITGWKFGLNPWQFTQVTATTIAANQYSADQTIIIQQAYVDSATGNNLSVLRSTSQDVRGLEIRPLTAHNQFGLLQWIDNATFTPYWANFTAKLSSLVNAYFVNSHSTTLKLKMRLIWQTTLPSTTSQTYPVASWTEGQDPVFAAGITAIAPRNDPVYTMVNGSIFGFNQYPFNAFDIPLATTDTMSLGIFVYTITNMNQNATADFVIFNDISLVPNEFAIASNAKTFDQVLKECQYYYAKTFPQGTIPATGLGSNGALFYNAYAGGALANSLVWQFPSIMRTTPTMTAYNPVSANAKWRNNTTAADSGTAGFANTCNRSVVVENPQVLADNQADSLTVHVTADARLGI